MNKLQLIYNIIYTDFWKSSFVETHSKAANEKCTEIKVLQTKITNTLRNITFHFIFSSELTLILQINLKLFHQNTFYLLKFQSIFFHHTIGISTHQVLKRDIRIWIYDVFILMTRKFVAPQPKCRANRCQFCADLLQITGQQWCPAHHLPRAMSQRAKRLFFNSRQVSVLLVLYGESARWCEPQELRVGDLFGN